MTVGSAPVRGRGHRLTFFLLSISQRGERLSANNLCPGCSIPFQTVAGREMGRAVSLCPGEKTEKIKKKKIFVDKPNWCCYNLSLIHIYVLSSVLCSVGGICYCLNTMSGSVQQATGLEMDAIASSVIGGTLLTGGVGNVIGSFFGVLINGTISSIVKTNGKLASSWPNILTAALLCFFIVLQSVFALIKSRKK